MEGKILIEELLAYAQKFLHLPAADVVYLRNVLMHELRVEIPYDGAYVSDATDAMTVPDALIAELGAYAREQALIEEGEEERFTAWIFGLLSPHPSEINRRFYELRERDPQAACDDFYDLCIKNNYIQKTAIGRNLKWTADDGKHTLEITINLSKPEKDNKEIAKLIAKQPKTDVKYPACALCKENEGFYGTETHPARSNHRTVDVRLGGEDWFLQYSPYSYYDEHCIVINRAHTPMRVDGRTVEKLLDFVDFLPNYFIGSNASLPIVGGSILNHEHFQGGLHLMPMHYAGVRERWRDPEFPEVEMAISDWYNSVVHLESADRDALKRCAVKIIERWGVYDDASCDVISRSADGTPHNAVTPILRKKGDRYIFDAILRNNRTSERYPDGIYHAHPEYFNIKKEGIGIIEVMGLFILPGRLKRQLAAVADLLCGDAEYREEEISRPEHDLHLHASMIRTLKQKYPDVSRADAETAVRQYVDDVCVKVLECTAVFKNDRDFGKFLSGIGCVRA